MGVVKQHIWLGVLAPHGGTSTNGAPPDRSVFWRPPGEASGAGFRSAGACSAAELLCHAALDPDMEGRVKATEWWTAGRDDFQNLSFSSWELVPCKLNSYAVIWYYLMLFDVICTCFAVYYSVFLSPSFNGCPIPPRFPDGDGLPSGTWFEQWRWKHRTGGFQGAGCGWWWCCVQGRFEEQTSAAWILDDFGALMMTFSRKGFGFPRNPGKPWGIDWGRPGFILLVGSFKQIQGRSLDLSMSLKAGETWLRTQEDPRIRGVKNCWAFTKEMCTTPIVEKHPQFSLHLKITSVVSPSPNPKCSPGGMDVLVDNMLGEIAKFGPSDQGGLSEEAIQAAAKHWSSRSLASLVSDEEEEASPEWAAMSKHGKTKIVFCLFNEKTATNVRVLIVAAVLQLLDSVFIVN